MKKSLLSFLTVRVQLVLLFALGGAIWLTTIQNQRLYREQVKNANKNAFTSDSEETVGQLEDKFEGYAVAVKGMVKDISSMSGPAQTQQIEALLSKKPGYVSFHIFKRMADGKVLPMAEGFTKVPDSRRMGGKAADKIFSRLGKFVLPWLEDELKKNPKQDRYVKSMTPRSDMPVFAVASSYSDGSDGVAHWGVLIIWNDEIRDILRTRENSTYQQIVLDSNAQMLMALDPELVKRAARYDSLPGMATAKGGEGGSVFWSTYRDESQREWMGAVHISEKFHFSVLTQMTVQEAYRPWEKAIMETLGIVGCYGAIFLLIGFLVTVDNSRKVAALIQAVHKIAAGNLDTAVRVKGGDNLAMLGMTLNHMTDRLKKIIIHNLLKVRNEKFHEIATIIADWKNVQAADSQGKGLTVSTSFSRTGTSSSEFACSLPGTQGICYLLIGSGVHPGLKGAMESAMLYAAVDALIQAKNGGEIDPRPSEILTDLDKTFHRIAGGSFQGSLFVGMMDTCYGTMLYASAGNNVPVLVMQNSGEDPRLVGLKVPPAQKFAVIALDSQSEAIGNGAAQFEDKSITLQTGEKIVYYAKSVADSSRNGMTKLSTIAISQTLAGMGSFDGDAIIRNLSQLSRDAEQQNEADVAMVVAQFNKLEAAMPTKQPVLAASTALDPFDPFNPSGNAKESKPAPVAEGQPGSKKENALLGDFHFQETGSNVSPARAQSSTPPQHGAAKKLMEDLDDNPFVLGKAARTQTSQEQKEHLPRDEVALDVPAKDVELTNQLGSVGNVPTPPIAKPVQGAKNTGKAEPAHQVPSQEHSVQLSAHFEDEDEPKLAEGREMILPEAAPIASSDTHAVKLSANFVLDDEEEGKEKAAPARQATVPQDDLSHSGKKIKLSAFAQDEQDDVSLVSRTSPRPPSPPALPIKPVPPPPPGPGRAEAKKHDHEVPPTPDFTGAFGEQKIGSDAVLPPPPPTAEEWAGAYKAMGIAPMPETALDDADKTDGKEIEKGDLASMEPDAAPLFTVPQEAEADVPQLIQEELPEYHLDITSVNEADTAVRALAFEQVPSEEKNENGSNGGGDSLVRMLSRDFFPAVAQTSLLPSFDMENEFEKQDEDAATGPAEDVTLTFSGASDPAKKATEPMGSEVLPAPPSTRDKAKRNSAPAYFDDDDLFSLRKKPS